MIPNPPDAHNAPPDSPDGLPVHPTDVLWELMAAFLAPMFLSARFADLGLARAAAMETMGSYRARTQQEVINICQIIAFGLAAMDSLWLSMPADIPLAMKLRLRGTANALNRSAQQNTRVLDGLRALHSEAVMARRPGPPPAGAFTTGGGPSDAAAQAAIDHAREMARQSNENMQRATQAAKAGSTGVPAASAQVASPPFTPAETVPDVLAPSALAPTAAMPPATAPVPTLPGIASPVVAAPVVAAPVVAAPVVAAPVMAPPIAAMRAPAPATARPVAGHPGGGAPPAFLDYVPRLGPSRAASMAENVHNLMWADGMTSVADELTRNLENVPPAQRKTDSMWASALRASASTLAMAAGSGKVPMKPIISGRGKPPGSV